jgi:hypothetical protein
MVYKVVYRIDLLLSSGITALQEEVNVDVELSSEILGCLKGAQPVEI